MSDRKIKYNIIKDDEDNDLIELIMPSGKILHADFFVCDSGYIGVTIDEDGEVEFDDLYTTSVKA
jgi:hypothetical protein